MEFKELERLLTNFEASELNKLEFKTEDLQLYLSKAQPKQLEKVEVVKRAPANRPEGTFLKAPVVGSVYLQARPGQKPYVSVGTKVKKGEVVCIIEAMKTMTEVKSDQTGIIQEVLVANEELVEYDQPLFKLSKEDADV